MDDPQSCDQSLKFNSFFSLYSTLFEDIYAIAFSPEKKDWFFFAQKSSRTEDGLKQGFQTCGPRKIHKVKKNLIEENPIFLYITISMAWRAMIIFIFGPWDIFFSKCRTQVDLSLRPLVYIKKIKAKNHKIDMDWIQYGRQKIIVLS